MKQHTLVSGDSETEGQHGEERDYSANFPREQLGLGI